MVAIGFPAAPDTFLHAAIHIAQEWKRWTFAPPGLHVWEMFLKPAEIKKMLALHSLYRHGHTGAHAKRSVSRIAAQAPHAG